MIPNHKAILDAHTAIFEAVLASEYKNIVVRVSLVRMPIVAVGLDNRTLFIEVAVASVSAKKTKVCNVYDYYAPAKIGRMAMAIIDLLAKDSFAAFVDGSGNLAERCTKKKGEVA